MNAVISTLPIARHRFASFIIGSIFLLTSTVCQAERGAVVKQTLNPWTLTDVGGKQLNFAPSSGKDHRVILFWASWCPYCKALMPHLERFREAHQNDSIAFYALNIWEDADAESYVKKTGFKFRLFLQADEVAKDYGLKGTPGLYLVDDRNQVLYQRRSGTSPEQVVTDLEFILVNRQQ
ncbi:MAG: TlpA family protein disulfide reductase [Gammaproteobacteria bacterium]